MGTKQQWLGTKMATYQTYFENIFSDEKHLNINNIKE